MRRACVEALQELDFLVEFDVVVLDGLHLLALEGSLVDGEHVLGLQLHELGAQSVALHAHDRQHRLPLCPS